MEQPIVYNSNQISVIFGPHMIIWGRGEEEFCKVEYEGDLAEDVVGSCGGTLVSVSNDRRATVTLTLLYGSVNNEFLSATANMATLTGGVTLMPLLIKDLTGTTLFAAQHAYIQKKPDVTYGKSPSDNVWVIRALNLIGHVGAQLPVV